jgi:hypothetical protein
MLDREGNSDNSFRAIGFLSHECKNAKHLAERGVGQNAPGVNDHKDRCSGLIVPLNVPPRVYTNGRKRYCGTAVIHKNEFHEEIKGS